MKIIYPLLLSSLLTDLLAGPQLAASSRLLSLEELMDVKVTSTSRRAEDQNLAAGVVTIVSSQEIKQYGARHLRDVVDRIVGTQVLGSHQDYHSKTSMRGFNSSHHEGHVLLLLNGRPVRQATDGGLNSDFYLGFPLNIIERIEVVRGPGSVIYGTNAVTGVLNIITKTSTTAINETQIDIGGGSFGRGQLQVSTLVGDDDYSLNLGANLISANGDTIKGTEDRFGTIGDYEWGQNSKNIVATGSYKNFTFNAIAMNNVLSGSNSNFQLPSKTIDLERYFLDVGYLHQINDSWDASVNYTVQKDSAVWQILEALGNNKSHAISQLTEVIVRGQVGSDLNLLFGASHNAVESEFDKFIAGNQTLPKTKSYYQSMYTQADYMLSDKQKVIAGIQWNKTKGLDESYSPRLGFIQGFGESTWLKFLYSQAFRSPTFTETSLNAPALIGNPDLKPEEVETYDIQLINQTANSYAALTLYHSKLENIIVRKGLPNPDEQENRGFIKFQGIEFEGKYEFNEDFSILGNASYQENVTDDGTKQSTFAPEVMVKLGGSYSGFKGITMSAFNSYIGESTDLVETVGADDRNPKADAYNMLTANLIADTGVLWGLGKPGNSLISIYVDNILDENVYAPDLNYAGTNNTIPHHWGLGAYATYTYKF